jgi:hypothetical protein
VVYDRRMATPPFIVKARPVSRTAADPRSAEDLEGVTVAHLWERIALAIAGATLANAPAFVPRAADASDELPAAVLRAHGRLGAALRLALAERALARVVAPAAARLLEPWTTAAVTGPAIVLPITS